MTYSFRLFVVGSAIAMVLDLAAVDLAAQDKAAPAATAARCSALARAIARSDLEKPGQHLSGRRVRTDVAVSLCAAGDYERGVAMLEQVAREADLLPLVAK
jgi:hypothetical protein